MCRVIFLVFCLFFGGALLAQVSTGVTVTGRHASVLKEARSTKAKKERKERRVKQTKDELATASDTLAAMDSAHYSIQKPDTLAASMPEVSAERVTTGAITEQRAEALLASQLDITEPAAPLQGALPDATIPELPASDLGADLLPKVNLNPGALNMAKMKSLMEGISFDQLEDAHFSMEVLKEKYSSVPSLIDTSSWVKSSSLKGQPIIDRFFISGNTSITSTDPLALDLNLQLGFRIDRHFSAGVGVIWRESFDKKQDSLALLSRNSHGFSVFGSYKFGRGFLAWGEYSTLQNTPILKEGVPDVPWQNQYLIGIGKTFAVANFIQMSTMILYDFNFRYNDLHPRPFIVRIGYTVNKPSFKKRDRKKAAI